MTITNNGDKAVSGIDCVAVFWKDGAIVQTLNEDFGKVKPGKSKNMTFTAPEGGYDSIDFFMFGSLASETDIDEFDEEEVASQLNVKEYRYSDSRYNYVVLEIENTSDFDLRVGVYTEFYDGSNRVLHSEESNVYHLESGNKTILELGIKDAFTRVQYELTPTQDYREGATADLSCSTERWNDKELITVTNTGDHNIDTPECKAVFWNEGVIVDVGTVTFWELSPGKSMTMELESAASYDRVDYYWTASESFSYSEDDTFDAEAAAKKMKVEEYRFTRYGTNYVLLVIENKTTEHVSIRVAVKYYNGSNRLVGAQVHSGESFVAPGTKIAVELSENESFTRVAYDLNVSKSYGEGAADAINWTIDASEKTITATNSSDREVSSPSVRLVFWRNGNIVSTTWVYLSADEYYMKPGETRSDSFYCYEDFDRVEAYWSCAYNS